MLGPPPGSWSIPHGGGPDARTRMCPSGGRRVGGYAGCHGDGIISRSARQPLMRQRGVFHPPPPTFRSSALCLSVRRSGFRCLDADLSPRGVSTDSGPSRKTGRGEQRMLEDRERPRGTASDPGQRERCKFIASTRSDFQTLQWELDVMRARR